MDNKQFFIPIVWEVKSSIIVDADSLEEAVKMVKKDFSSFIPDDYVHDFESVEVINGGCYEYVE